MFLFKFHLSGFFSNFIQAKFFSSNFIRAKFFFSNVIQAKIFFSNFIQAKVFFSNFIGRVFVAAIRVELLTLDFPKLTNYVPD